MIRSELREEPCSLCGHPQMVRVFTEYPKLEAPPRPAEEHEAAQRNNEHQHEQTARRQNARV